MKKAYFSFVTFLFLGAAVMAHAQGTSLTYEGRLDVTGAPATGAYDLTFTLFDSSTNGNQQGNTVTNLATGVTNGLFTVIIDFGNEFPGAARWLEIGVRTNGGGTFSTLAPRQQLTSTPYAVQAVNAAAASVAATASSVAAGNITGTLSTAQLPASVITNGASGVTVSGTFSGNGAGITNVPGTLPWNQVMGTNTTASANQAYLLNNNSPTTLALPTSANVGDVVAVSGVGSNGWQAVIGYGPSPMPAFTAQSSLSLPWQCVASSADGTKLVAGTYNQSLYSLNDSGIYTSTNSGVTWTTQTGGLATTGFSGWRSVASSSDGTKLVAVQYPGQIFTSANSGVSWTVQANAPSTNWESVASSADGTKLAAAAYGGLIYTSANAGVTWTPQIGSGSLPWSAVASSADGTKLVAATYNENLNTLHDSGIYNSTDSGVTWTRQTNGLPTTDSSTWTAVTCSADGTKVAAASQSYLIYTSTNSGANWTARTGSTYEYWSSLACSASGSELVAVSYPVGVNQKFGQVSVSTNWGAAWVSQTNGINWQSVAASSDASKLVAVSFGGPIYTAGPSTPIYFNGTPGAYTEFQYLGNGAWQALGNPAGQIVGNIPAASLPAGLITNGATGVSLAGIFSGNGGSLTNLNASNLASGTVPSAVFSGTYGNALNFTNAGNSFTGNGGGLTNLSASALTTGTLPTAQLPASVVTNGASGVTVSGTFSGNGAGVTNVLLSTLNTTGFITWPGDFTPSFSFSPFGLRFLPTCVTTADVNGDGKVDLICADGNGGELLVLTNTGGGSFVLASQPVTGSNPNSVVAADVNGDGKVDLISANFGTNTLTVLTNDGTGNFVLASSPIVGNGPISVVAADVNGDGKVDLICVNNTDATLTVLTNNGAGAFVLASSPARGQWSGFSRGGGCQRRWQGGFDLRELQRQHTVGADQQWQRRLCVRCHPDRGDKSGFSRGSGC